MYRLAYILPLVTAVTMFFVIGDEELWFAFLAALTVCEVLIYMALRRAHRVVEYLSGYAIEVEHHEAWTEKVVTYVSYRDSSGNMQTRRQVSYVYHPDVWLATLNTGEVEYISSDTYHDTCRMWATGEEEIFPPHVNCVSGGGGQACRFSGRYDDGITCTYKGLYENYVRNSNSIFKLNRVSKSEARRLGLVEYPSFDDAALDIDAVLVAPSAVKIIGEDVRVRQRDIQLINAYEGERREIHIFVLLFDAAQGVQVAIKQREYWRGGNKNEFVLCLGKSGNSDDTELPKVEWSKGFSWCDAPRLESASESWFIENPKLDLEAYAGWLRDNLSLWKRKEFSDFKYLGRKLSPKRRWLIALLSILLSVAIVWFAFDITR